MLLASGWMIGSIYSASVGWALIPTHGWRTFVAASALPALVCLAGVVTWMPESPRFLAVAGRTDEATDVVRRIAKGNGNEPTSSSRFNRAEGSSRPGRVHHPAVATQRARGSRRFGACAHRRCARGRRR